MSSNSQNDVAKIGSPPDGLTRCNGGNGTRTCAPRRTEAEAGHRAACWRRGAERWHVLPGQARTWTVLMLWLQPGWTGSPSGLRVVLACSGCGALLLYTVISRAQVFEINTLTCVELWGFEPQTSCMPSEMAQVQSLDGALAGPAGADIPDSGPGV